METVGKIFNSSPNNYGQFATDVQDFNGDPPVFDSNGVYNPGIDSRWEFLPDVRHSFASFNISVDLDITDPAYNIEIGLKGKQLNWPTNTLFRIVRTGNNTTVSLGGQQGVSTRFTEILPKVLTGLVKVRINYESLQWNISIIYQGSEYNYTYRYQRPAVNGHVTSVFAFNNFGGTCTIKKFIIDVPILKGQALFVGDSITWGSNRPFGSRTFAEQYNANDAKCSVFASGSVASQDVMLCYKAIELLAPSEIYLLVGDNDDYNNPSSFQSNIETILDDWFNTLPANGVPTPIVTLMNLTPELTDSGYAALRDVIDAMVLPEPHRKVDSWRALARGDMPDLVYPDYVADHVHLSGEGHNKIYQLL